MVYSESVLRFRDCLVLLQNCCSFVRRKVTGGTSSSTRKRSPTFPVTFSCHRLSKLRNTCLHACLRREGDVENAPMPHSHQDVTDSSAIRQLAKQAKRRSKVFYCRVRNTLLTGPAQTTPPTSTQKTRCLLQRRQHTEMPLGVAVPWHQIQLIITACYVRYRIARGGQSTALVLDSEIFLKCHLMSGLRQLAVAGTSQKKKTTAHFAAQHPLVTGGHSISSPHEIGCLMPLPPIFDTRVPRENRHPDPRDCLPAFSPHCPIPHFLMYILV